MRRALFAGVLLCFLSGVLGGDLPLIRLTTNFQLDSCQAFAGTQKQATVRAFCQTINDRANFPSDTTCDVDNSGCIELTRRVLLQTGPTAAIVQQGSFGGSTSAQVEQAASDAVTDTTSFQEDLVQTLLDTGNDEIADQMRNTTIEGASSATEEDPPPIPNECVNNVDCDVLYTATPFCLTTAEPYICVQCVSTDDCDSGEVCSGLNVCQPSP